MSTKNYTSNLSCAIRRAARKAAGSNGDGRPAIRPMEDRVRALGRLMGMVCPVPEEWKRPPGTNGKKRGEEGGVLEVGWYNEIEPEPVDWLWENRIARGELNQFHGDPGGGKTWLVLYIASCVTTGRPFFDGSPCPQGRVLFVTSEDSHKHTVRPRLNALGADVSKIAFLKFVTVKGKERRLALDQNIPALDRWLSQHPDVLFVAIDPLAAFLGKVRANVNAEVRGVQDELLKVAEKHNVAMQFIDHLSKNRDNPALGGIGSVAFTAGPRVVWQVRRDLDDESRQRRFWIPNKINIAPEWPKAWGFRLIKDHNPPLVWDEQATDITIEEASTGTPRASKKEEAKRWIQEQLKDGPVPSAEMEKRAERDKIRHGSLTAAKKELGIVADKNGSGPWSWVTPEQKAALDKEKAESEQAKRNIVKSLKQRKSKNSKPR